jgi:hypothetical protein
MTLCNRVCLAGLLTVIVPSLIVTPPSRAAPGASLADPAAEQPTASPAEDSGIILLKPDGLETILGREVRTTEAERDVGRIIDVLADRNGRVRAVVIEFGGFLGIGTRKIAVEWSALRYDGTGGHASWLVDVSRDQLRAAPDYKATAPAVVPRASN